MKLTAENVEIVLQDSLFRDNEIVDGEPPVEPVIAEGIMRTFGFHPDRLDSHCEDVQSMLMQLPEAFMRSKGGGWSFLNACYDANNEQWTGLHQTMDSLFVLGIALGLVEYLLPRELWPTFPGGMPYIVING